MTFAQRQINLQFSDQKRTLTLEGLRVKALVNVPGGVNAYAQLELRAYGMSLDQMNQFSSTGADMIALEDRTVTLSAGDVGSPIRQAFSGTVVRSFIDFSEAPDVAFVCSAASGLYQKVAPTSPNSFKGAHNAEDIIAGLASNAGFAFTNNGAHAVLQNQYVYGSLLEQIEKVAQAAGFAMEVANGSVTIWPNNGYRDQEVIDIGPDTGMVGYPTFDPANIVVMCEFNPQIVMGRRIRVTSSIPKANGTWPVQTVLHELTTLEPDGPWFTTTRLSPFRYVPSI